MTPFFACATPDRIRAYPHWVNHCIATGGVLHLCVVAFDERGLEAVLQVEGVDFGVRDGKGCTAIEVAKLINNEVAYGKLEEKVIGVFEGDEEGVVYDVFEVDESEVVPADENNSAGCDIPMNVRVEGVINAEGELVLDYEGWQDGHSLGSEVAQEDYDSNDEGAEANDYPDEEEGSSSSEEDDTNVSTQAFRNFAVPGLASKEVAAEESEGEEDVDPYEEDGNQWKGMVDGSMDEYNDGWGEGFREGYTEYAYQDDDQSE